MCLRVCLRAGENEDDLEREPEYKARYETYRDLVRNHLLGVEEEQGLTIAAADLEASADDSQAPTAKDATKVSQNQAAVPFSYSDTPASALFVDPARLEQEQGQSDAAEAGSARVGGDNGNKPNDDDDDDDGENVNANANEEGDNNGAADSEEPGLDITCADWDVEAASSADKERIDDAGDHYDVPDFYRRLRNDREDQDEEGRVAEDLKERQIMLSEQRAAGLTKSERRQMKVQRKTERDLRNHGPNPAPPRREHERYDDRVRRRSSSPRSSSSRRRRRSRSRSRSRSPPKKVFITTLSVSADKDKEKEGSKHDGYRASDASPPVSSRARAGWPMLQVGGGLGGEVTRGAQEAATGVETRQWARGHG